MSGVSFTPFSFGVFFGNSGEVEVVEVELLLALELELPLEVEAFDVLAALECMVFLFFFLGTRFTVVKGGSNTCGT